MPRKQHAPRAARHEPHDGFERAGLARTVAPNEGHHFATLDMQLRVKHDLRRAIPSVEALHIEQG